MQASDLILAVPLFGLAGSAIAFVVKLFQDAAERRRTRFFDMMQRIDGQGTIASKVAAVYALRDFPEHRDFIVRFCRTQKHQIIGENAKSLADEMTLTEKVMS